jgi:hypothetical protein
VGVDPASPPADAGVADSVSFGFDDSSPESRLALELLGRRSTFAQPEPLNTTVGGANAFRTGPPPQFGQVSGP